MRYGRLVGLIVVLALAAGLAGGMVVWRRAGASPASLIGPNLLANSDFAADADGDQLPDGWSAADRGGVRWSDFRFAQGAPGRSMQLDGINNYLLSPLIAAKPGMSYRVAFRVLADNQAKPSPTQVRVRFHWIDAEGVEIGNVAGEWQDAPHRIWATVSSAAEAPAAAARLRISIHPASDDRIIIDELGLGQLGVRIAPWPAGKRAALALSFDYETAMGGLIHSRSDDPNRGDNPLDRARRMRQGVDEILDLFEPAGIRGTWYANGYNFLTGNQDRRVFMDNPTYAWANSANGWPSDHWARTPWFGPDPYLPEQSAPEWYFGSQIALLQAANQDVQSHTFAHFDGGLVTPADWQADFTAWTEVATVMNVPKATSLAFPWSSTAGMRWDSWEALAEHGVTSVTRTNWNQPRFRIADRETYGLRRLPGHASITVIADEYLTTESLPRVLERLALARLNEGAIDVWAHTEEVVSAAQQAAWARVIAAREPFWVAPVPEITAWERALDDVTIQLQSEQPRYRFRVRNAGAVAVRELTLVLPFAPMRMTVEGQTVAPTGDRLIVDVPARQSIEVELWPA